MRHGLAALLLLQACSPAHATEPPPWGEVGQCSPRGGPALRWSPEVRREARARAKAACRADGATPLVCALQDVIAVRESSGRPGVRHRRGQDRDGRPEDGLGLHGLSLRWHRDKWPGEDEDPSWCQPEASWEVVSAIFRRAVTRYHANDAIDLQSIFAGRWDCQYLPERYCYPRQIENPRLCAALKSRGHDCRTPITLGDLGRRVRRKDRAARARALAERFAYRADQPND